MFLRHVSWRFRSEPSKSGNVADASIGLHVLTATRACIQSALCVQKPDGLFAESNALPGPLKRNEHFRIS